MIVMRLPAWDQTPLTPTLHNLLIIPGDEEIWCRCTCGWPIPNHYPTQPSKHLNDVWEAWYWTHAIKEEIKVEEAERATP